MQRSQQEQESPDPLAALQGGDPGPFEAFVRDQTPALRAFFRRLGAPPAEADDLVQDTFLKLYRTAPSYQPQGRFLPYAFRVARNAWIDRQRRQHLRPVSRGPESGRDDGEGPDPLVSLAGSETDPLELASRNEQVSRLGEALQQLSESHRMVFELGVLQELPYSEIGEILGIPVGTVKSRMFHAVRKLRTVLEQESARDASASEGTQE